MILVALGCVADDSAAVVTETAAEFVECPPPEPTGLAVGERALDVAFTDCAGAATSLHGLCGRPALVLNWYGWCPSCEANAELARRLADAHAGLAVAVVLTENPLSEPADPAFCADYVEANPSAAYTWTDPLRGLEAYGDTDLVLVLARDGTITFQRQTSSEELIVAAVEEVL